MPVERLTARPVETVRTDKKLLEIRDATTIGLELGSRPGVEILG
jgi:hypothetical protein